jgi:diguanylate cyclase (GGDEF)-like protein/PAS domain S-box-containing protein
MPTKTRDLALETLLLMVAATLLVMGVAGLVFGMGFSHTLFSVTLVPDASLATLLIGAGLLAVFLRWGYVRRGCGGLLVILLLYTLVHNGMAGHQQGSWLTGQARMTTLAAGALMAVAAMLWIGFSTPCKQRLWIATGIGLWLFFALVVFRLWQGMELYTPMFSSPPLAVAVFIFLLGTVMMAVARYPPTQRLVLSRVTLIASLGGVVISCAVWLLLSIQQQADIRAQALNLLDNVQLNAEQAMDERLQLMQRMADRLDAVEGELSANLFTQDAHSYFRDTPSLLAIALLDERSTIEQFLARSTSAEPWLAQQLAHDSVRNWLSIPFARPRTLVPDATQPSLALLTIPVASSEQYLVASLDLSVMLNNDLRLALGAFQVSIYRGESLLLTLSTPGFEADRVPTLESALASRHAGLPGGITVNFYALPGSQYNWFLMGLVPALVALGGLLLSWLLAFSLGMVGSSTARAKELSEARHLLEDQQHIQGMIAQEQPLDDILESLCRMLERQLPGALCSIMLANAAQTALHFAAGQRLPQRYRGAIDTIEIGIDIGACGSAAYLRAPVVCVDIPSDRRWKGFQAVASQAGIVACWSSPVMSSDDQLVGTFAAYYGEKVTPTAKETALIDKAAGLMSVAVERCQVRRSLQESEQRYRSLFTHHPDAVFSLDAKGRFVTANATCATITGYAIDEIIGQHFTHFIAACDVSAISTHFDKAMQGGITRYELTITDRSGHGHMLDLINMPIVVNDEIQGMHGIAQDVTASRQQEVRLRILERGVEASIDGVLIADATLPDTPIIYANQAFTTMTGYSQEEIIGRNCRLLQGHDSDPALIALMRRNLKAERDVNVTLCNYRKDGTPFWNDLYISPVRDQEGRLTHFVGVQHDVSKHKAYEARLAYLATHDDLTRLPNRSLFEDKLLEAFSHLQTSSQRLAVLFVDLDDFKPINDNLGHAIGDCVLQDVAQRLSGAVQKDDIVARLGGDEFVILQANAVDDADILAVAEQILATLSRPYCVDGHELYLTASIGIAISEGHTVQPQTLIQQADMAMYKAKQQGRNAYEWFNHDFTDTVSERMVLRNDLQEAIERDEFELHYQPLIGRRGELVSVEALLRWKHPSKGFISPARFIPLAETTGQIMPISEWVLKRACNDMQALCQKGFGRVRVAVNLSPLQFHRANFLSTLQETLSETGLPPHQLGLELTEGILMNNTEGAIHTLHVLRDMQIGVSIDDFGTGFSSLSYLKDLPINTVKIDRSFIHELTHSSDDMAIVQGIISMAHHLGLNVVAEGVETHEQHQRLLAYQCDVFQGFGLARPMPLDALETFITTLAATPLRL